MFGLAHRGWSLNDYSEHLVHPLRSAGYRSVLIGEQHISRDPAVIGYDEIREVDSNHAADVAPIANATLREVSEPFFLSVGFFETHREFHAPTSVRDTLYSLPAPNLPDTLATREDMAAFKASARSLDQGIGSVLNELYGLGLVRANACGLHDRPRPRLPAREGDAVRPRHRGDASDARPRRVLRRQGHRLDGQPSRRLSHSLRGRGGEPPDYLQGTSLLPLVRDEVTAVRDELFTEMTFHAAYEPQRAVRTGRWKYIRRFHDYERPVLANCDDSETKELMIEAGWGGQYVPEEQLYDLVLDPERKP